MAFVMTDRSVRKRTDKVWFMRQDGGLIHIKVAMSYFPMVRGFVLSLSLTAASAAFAQVNVNILFAPPAPPAPMHEVVPMMAPGYVWAPGYWAWNLDRHIWVRGRTMVQRTGYRWEPDRWEQRDGHYMRQPGRWMLEPAARPMQVRELAHKHDNGQRHNNKKDKKDKRGKDDRNNRHNNDH